MILLKIIASKKFANIVGRFITSFGIIFRCCCWTRRYPADLLKELVLAEEIKVFQKGLRHKVRAGDINKSDDPTDPNYNKSSMFAEASDQE